MTAHIYLAPHFDDAVLSCGGLILRQSSAGEPVLVVTIFGGAPGQLSPLAQSLHATWRLGLDATQHRAAEDRRAVAALGAQTAHWAFPDSIYRAHHGQPLYPDFAALFGPRHPADAELVARIAAHLLELPACARYYAPLAVGSHVDHAITRDAAAALRAAGRRVLFYEDQPYICHVPFALGPALRQAGARRWQPQVAPISGDRKRAAMALYRSQWYGDRRTARAMGQYARRVGLGAGPAERLWRPLDQEGLA